MSTSAQTPQVTANDDNPFLKPLPGPSAQADDDNPFLKPLPAPQSSSSSEPDATVAVPDAGRIPGVMSFGNKVTPAQAAGGLAAGAVAGAAPLAISEIPGAFEALASHADEQIGAWAAKYPHLVAIGSKLGIPTATTALLGWMIHSAKSASK
jgi:hypothetical protein